MKIFQSLSLFKRGRLFLCPLILIGLFTAVNHGYGQFKFREPLNRQNPQALGTRDGAELWNRFLANRSIGLFEIQGKLVYRSAGQKSKSMEFNLYGEWRNGIEKTRIHILEEGVTLLHKEVISGIHPTTLRDLEVGDGPQVINDVAFSGKKLAPDLPLTWNDVLMPFLSWEEYNYLGPDRYLGRPAHQFELVNPDDGVNPVKVIVTLDEDFAALLKADVHGMERQDLKRIRVGGFKQYGEAWMFSELNWESPRLRESMRLTVSNFSVQP